jgi:hypothetical protein
VSVSGIWIAFGLGIVFGLEGALARRCGAAARRSGTAGERTADMDLRDRPLARRDFDACRRLFEGRLAYTLRRRSTS